MQKIGTVNKTREILEKNGFYMKKKFGQNFLIDQNILSGIVQKAEINKSVNVIEIGPGIGSLTEHLLENANKVISYEIDNSLIPILTEQFACYDNFTLINQDILKADVNQDIDTYLKDYENVYVSLYRGEFVQGKTYTDNFNSTKLDYEEEYNLIKIYENRKDYID